MLFLQQPPDTSAYMIAGYVVIFGTMLAYVISLIIRRRNLEQDMQVLQELDNTEKATDGLTFVGNSHSRISEEEEPSVRNASN